MSTFYKKRNTHKITASEMKAMREEDHRMVTGVFRNIENPGVSEVITYKKYPGDPVFSKKMESGKAYQVPLMVAKHINKACRYEVHKHAVDESGKPHKAVGEVVQRYSFESTDFHEDFEPEKVDLKGEK